MPTIIAKIFAIPNLAKFKHPIHLHYDDEFKDVIPHKKDKVTLLYIENGKVQSISYVSTPKELQASIEE